MFKEKFLTRIADLERKLEEQQELFRDLYECLEESEAEVAELREQLLDAVLSAPKRLSSYTPVKKRSYFYG